VRHSNAESNTHTISIADTNPESNTDAESNTNSGIGRH
jgi:hypothetical protein